MFTSATDHAIGTLKRANVFTEPNEPWWGKLLIVSFEALAFFPFILLSPLSGLGQKFACDIQAFTKSSEAILSKTELEYFSFKAALVGLGAIFVGPEAWFSFSLQYICQYIQGVTYTYNSGEFLDIDNCSNKPSVNNPLIERHMLSFRSSSDRTNQPSQTGVLSTKPTP